ncbi:MAG: DEAD/DEAH box helicase family protein [Solirubrobacterales bacterium]
MSSDNESPRPPANDHRSLAAELDQVRAERESLRTERDDLRRLLGMSPELVDAHRAAVGTTLFEESTNEQLADVNMHSAPSDKVVLFASLFRGRDDVFAQRWSNEQSGKSGYAPAVLRGARASNFGKSKDARPLLPMTTEVIEQHLRGEIVAGVYPVLSDGTCNFVACDFDGAGWALDALAYLHASAASSVPAALERSRSGDGAHVWIFFADAVRAITARRLAMQLLRAAMDERCEIEFESYDRLFPSQDYVQKNGYGNLIALPLQAAARRNGNSEFLDPSTLEPWPDQWRFLAQVKRVGEADLDQLIEYLPPLEIGPDVGSRTTARSLEFPPPESISCTLASQLSIERAGVPPALMSALKHAATLHNPEWHKRSSLRLSTHSTPRFVRCYREDLTHLHLPRGLLDRATELIKQAGSSIELVDARRAAADIDFAFGLDLSAGQRAALGALARQDCGVLVAPPGAGKTRIACALIAERRVPTLVVAHTRQLLEQWRAAAGDALGLEPRQIGQYGGGRKRRSHIVDLATLQSLARLKDPAEFLSGYGMLVVDECHHIPAVSFEKATNHVGARYVLGLTATPVRRDGLQDIITMQCGPIRHRMSDSAAKRSDGPGPSLQLRTRTTGLECLADELDRPIQQHFAALVDDSDRIELICDDIAAAVSGGRRVIVLSEWKRHCFAIADGLGERGISPILFHGGLGKQARTRLLSELSATASDEPLVVVATSQLLGEGFDCPQLDTLFLAFPISFKGRIVQYTGRLMRDHPGKTSVQVYDYADDAVPVLAAMAKKRAAIFRTLGFVALESRHASRIE